MPEIDRARTVKNRIKKLIGERRLESLRRFRRKIDSAKKRMLGFTVKLIPLRARLFIKANTAAVERMDCAGSDIFIEVDSPIEYKTRLRSCSKEPETVAWISKYFRQGDIFYDVGANVGAYSLVAAKLCSGVFVYAFEPGFPTFHKLCRNIAINGCGDRIVPLQVALSDDTAMERFYYSDMGPGAAMHSLGASGGAANASFDAVCSQSVISFRMDDLISRFNLPCPGHIKIDVDGSELRVLRGAAGTLADPAVRTLLLELNESNRAEVAEAKDILLSRGFAEHSRHRTALCGTSDVCNYIFLKE